MKLNYYWAVFESTNHTVQVCDDQSHPFFWMKTQKASYGREWVCLNWKEISKEEFEYFKNNIAGRY